MNSEKKEKKINISSDISDRLEAERSEKRILDNESSFEIIEAYKAARTNIMFSLNNEKGCKTVVITSPTSGEGKTTSSINLAFTFAEIGARILLVDADLRAPRVHKYIKLENEKGLSNILAGFDDFDSCIQKDVRPNIDCITSGPIPPNPVELISCSRMQEFLDSLESKYDYVFIDTPPLNIVTEALVLSKMVSGVIVVTRQKYTLYKMIEKAVNALKFADAKILGFVLNDAEEDKYSYGGYKSGRGYRYRYRYRYRYSARYRYAGRKYGHYGYYGTSTSKDDAESQKPDGSANEVKKDKASDGEKKKSPFRFKKKSDSSK